MGLISIELRIAKLDDRYCVLHCRRHHVLRRLQGYFETVPAVESYSAIKGHQLFFRVANPQDLDDLLEHLRSGVLPLLAAEAAVIPPWPVRYMGLILATLGSLVFALATVDCLSRGESPWPTYLLGWAIVGLNLLSQHLSNLSLQGNLDEVHVQWLDSYR